MINTYSALRRPPEEILRQMVIESLKLPSDIQSLALGEPVVVSGTQTKIAIGVDRSIAGVEYWRYTDEIDFTYDRLDIQELFGDYVPTFRIPEYVSTALLWRRLEKETGVVFTNRDFSTIIVQPSETIVQLPINPASYRYVGQLNVKLLRK